MSAASRAAKRRAEKAAVKEVREQRKDLPPRRPKVVVKLTRGTVRRRVFRDARMTYETSGSLAFVVIACGERVHRFPVEVVREVVTS